MFTFTTIMHHIIENYKTKKITVTETRKKIIKMN